MEFKENQELEFNCYGVQIKGTFISKKDHLITVKIIYDESNVSNAGDIDDISQSFLTTKQEE